MSAEPLMWEVGNCLTLRESKFAKVFLFRFFTKLDDLFFIFRTSEIHADSINSDCAYPNLVFFSPIHPRMAALIVFSNLSVCGVLGSRYCSQILFAIIASVTIYVITVHFRVGQSEDKTMHKLTVKWRTIWSAGVESSSRMIPECVPVDSVNTLKFNCIYDSDLRFSERNKIDASILWLDDLIALNPIFRTGSTKRNRISHFIIVAQFGGN